MIFINSSPGNALKIFQPFLPIFVPVGIGYLMAVLERDGIKTICVDEQVEKNTLDKIKEQIKSIKPPYIFGFSVLTAAFKNAIHLSAILKELYPESVIIFGGIHPTAMPDECLSYSHVDMVVRGEAEEFITELYHCLKNKKDFSHLPSISYRKNGVIVESIRSAGTVELDELPAFPYGLFQNKKYDPGFVMSSRGCPYDCYFCSNKINSQRKFRFRSTARVMEELDLLYNKYHRRYVYFIDDNLLVNHSRILELARAIRSSEFCNRMIFNFQARGDNSSEEVLKELYEAGFRGVYFGIESSSEELMKVVNKGETVAQVTKAIRTAKKIGYHVSGNYIFGLPGEMHTDRMNAIKMTKKLDLDLVKYNNATPYPGTELYQQARKEGRLNIKGCYENINSVSTFIENPFKKIPFAYVPSGNTEKELRTDILHGYFKFYFHPKRIKGVFTRPDLNNAWFDFGHNPSDFLKKLPSIIVLFFFLAVKFSSYIFHYISKKFKHLSHS